MNCSGASGTAASEVILATDPDIEGEATATYLTRMLSTMDVPVSASPPACPWAATWSTRTR